MVKLFLFYVFIGLVVTLLRLNVVIPRLKKAFAERSASEFGKFILFDILGWPVHLRDQIRGVRAKQADDKPSETAE